MPMPGRRRWSLQEESEGLKWGWEERSGEEWRVIPILNPIFISTFIFMIMFIFMFMFIPILIYILMYVPILIFIFILILL